MIIIDNIDDRVTQIQFLFFYLVYKNFFLNIDFEFEIKT